MLHIASPMCYIFYTETAGLFGGAKMILINISAANAVIRKHEILTVGMVGAKVSFHFDEEWDGLTKTAVFRQGDVTRDVVDIGDEATIPSEVLQLAGIPVAIGIYGTNEDGSIVIPTIWAVTSPVRAGADPSGDESTDPDLEIWAQIIALIGDLSNLNTEAKNTLVAAINELVKPDSKIVDVELLAANWVDEEEHLYSQVVEMEGITAYSQVDLTPSKEQLAIFYEKDVAFVTENEDGVVTVFAIGEKPQNDYTIQATIVEVSA